MKGESSELVQQVTEITFTQYLANQDFKNHGKRAVGAIFKELMQ